MQTESVNNSVVVEPKGSIYKLRFDDQVIHPSYYRFELQALNLATEFDDVYATVNTDGGSLATGIEVVNEILSCKAPVKGILRSNCHSCGSIIFLACHTHEVGLASEMLLHSGSGGAGGTPTQSIQRAHSYKRQVRELFETVYRGFLEESELDKMIDEDKEYIFGADEIEERLQRMYSYRQDCANQYQEDMENQFVEENDKIIDETMASLGISQEHIDIFNQVREAVDNKILQDMSGVVGTESLDDVKENITSSDFVTIELTNPEGEPVGCVEKWEENDNVTYEFYLTSWAIALPYTGDVHIEYKAEVVEFLKAVTGKNYKNQNAGKLAVALLSVLVSE